MKKWFSVCLATLMLVSMMSVTVFAADSGVLDVMGQSGMTIINDCSYGFDTGNPVRKTDSYGKTIYILGNSLNNKVFPLSQAPNMDYLYKFNDVVFSNYIKNESTYSVDSSGQRIFVCKVTVGLDSVMMSAKGDVEFTAYPRSFNTVPTYLKGYGGNSDLVGYKTNTPYMAKKSTTSGETYYYLDKLYIRPYSEGGRLDNGHWNEGLAWKFEKNPEKVRSNGSYLDIFYIRVDHGTKVSYFEVRVTDETYFNGERNTSIEKKPIESTPIVTYPNTATAKPTTSRILINGQQVAFEAYNINDNNYFKLRDVALSLRGTEKQFEVVWNPSFKEGNIRGAIEMKSYSPYTTVGGEMALGDGYNKTAKLTNSPILKDGAKVTKLVGYNISDNNFFKLRDLGELFDFNVSWDGKLNTIIINTSESYDPSN